MILNLNVSECLGADLRERVVAENLEIARSARSVTDAYWKKMRSYYDGTHETERQTGTFLADLELPWRPCSVPDGFLHVEGQIEANTPDFEFSAHTDGDAAWVKHRENITRYLIQNADMTAKNAENERRLNIYGSAVWKLSVTQDENGLPTVGIENPPLDSVFPDPFAKTVDDCEYIACVYRMSAAKAARIFAEDLKKQGLSLENIVRSKHPVKHDPVGLGDTLEITEYWFRQPYDGEETIISDAQHSITYTYHSGDIALSILIEGTEIRYLPKFWSKTSCTKYPFVIYNKIPSSDTIWGKSELESIIPLIDAADRQLLFAQLNTAFFANDILVYEENAFSADSYPENRPGAVWKLRPGMSDKVRRLGGLVGDHIAHYEIAEKYRSMMKEALGNYDFMQGDNSTNVTTATGLALLGDYASKRIKAKNICKKAGFERLYRLIDALALEIFSAERLHDILHCDGVFCFEDYQREYGILPAFHIVINVGDGFEHSPSFTISALSELCAMALDADRYPIVRAYISALGIPEKAELLQALDARFAGGDASDQ